MFLSNDRGSGSSTPLYANDNSIFTTDTRPPPPPPTPFPFYHYPSSTFAEHDHSQLLVGGHLLPQHQLVTGNTNLISEVMIDMAVSDKKSTTDVNPSNRRNYCASMAIAEKQNPQKKRSVKRDRHSKITTAQGIRDRRMRLSLDVAREFFGLQDLRGDDKPSKTIRWLLNQCKGPMKELARAKELKTKNNCGGSGAKSTVSSTSECEVMSGIEENSNAGDISEKKALAKRRKRQPRKTNFHSIGKESREKARARARERTIEKIRGRESSSPSETGEESGVSHNHEMKFSMAEVAVVKEPSSQFLGLQRPNQNGIEEATAMTTTSINSSPSSIFSFQPENAISQGLVCSNNNNVSSYFENWDIDNTRAHYFYTSTAGNIQDRISSSVLLNTPEIHLPCPFSEVPNFGSKPNWEV